jgi:hypothetical protein
MVNKFFVQIDGKVVATRTSQNRNYVACIVAQGPANWRVRELEQARWKLQEAKDQGNTQNEEYSQKRVAQLEKEIQDSTGQWYDLGWASALNSAQTRANSERKFWPVVRVLPAITVPKGTGLPKVGDAAPTLPQGGN